MIYARFKDNETEITVEELHQWDIGQKLAITGVADISDTTEVHFANSQTETAIVKTGTYYSGSSTYTVDIPNAFLEKADGTPGKVYVYTVAPKTGLTIRTIHIPIIPRKKPEGFITPSDPDTKTLLDEALTGFKDIKDSIDNLEKQVETTIVRSDGNLNNYKTNGKYYFTTSITMSNQPDGVKNGWLVVLEAESFTKQIFFRCGNVKDLYRSDYQTFVRTCNGDGWSDWREITANKPVTSSDTGEDSANLNAFTKSGEYYFVGNPGNENFPPNTFSGFLSVKDALDGVNIHRVKQIFIPFGDGTTMPNSVTDRIDHLIYIRTGWFNEKGKPYTWSEWIETSTPKAFYANETPNTSNSDLNLYTHSGSWYFKSSDNNKNFPPNTLNGWLDVVTAGNHDEQVKQFFYRRGTLDTNDFEMYVRTGGRQISGSEWSDNYEYSQWMPIAMAKANYANPEGNAVNLDNYTKSGSWYFKASESANHKNFPPLVKNGWLEVVTAGGNDSTLRQVFYGKTNFRSVVFERVANLNSGTYTFHDWKPLNSAPMAFDMLEEYCVKTYINRERVKPITSNTKVLLLGDSIAYGVISNPNPDDSDDRSIYSWANVFQKMTGCNLDNRAVSGALLGSGRNDEVGDESKMLKSQFSSLNATDFDIVIVAIGTNDVGYKTTNAEIKSELISLFSWLKNTPAVFITPIKRIGASQSEDRDKDTVVEVNESTWQNQRLAEVSAIISNAAITNGHSLINGFDFPLLMGAVRDSDNQVIIYDSYKENDPNVALSRDTLHPSKIGHEIYAHCVYNIINSNSVSNTSDENFNADEILTGVEDIKAYLGYIDEDIAGICVDYKNKVFKRLAGAYGKTAGEDFDAFPMFGGRRRCNVSNDGTIVAYCGDADYAEDGSMGQVMVYQPKFYYKVVPLVYDKNTVSGIGYHLRKANYYVSSRPKTGFKLHPAFFDENGNEVDYILLSAYEGSMYDVSASEYVNDGTNNETAIEDGDLLCSIAGVKPISGRKKYLTKLNLELMAQNRNSGWHLETIKATNANQLLMIVELGTMNTQTGIGQGVTTIENNILCNCASLTGSTANLGNGTGSAAETINETGGAETAYTIAGKVSVSYRGVENPWGNIWKHIQGVNIWGDGTMGGGQPYVANNFIFEEIKNYDNYEPVGFTLASGFGYINAMGYGGEDFDWLLMPSEIGGTSALPVGDAADTSENLNGYCIAILGGHWSNTDGAGGFNWNYTEGIGAWAGYIGGRLLYVPTATV